MLRDILHHVSIMIIEPPTKNEFLMGVYDNTYPLKVFRERVNLIGGNQHPEDFSPRGILEREISEEFSIKTKKEENIEESISRTSGKGPGPPLPEKFAPERDIAKIREAIFLYCIPYGDFIINSPYLQNRDPNSIAIYSVYNSIVPSSIFECARDNFLKRNSITSEGFTAIVSIDNLKNGNPLSAGGTPLIMAHYLNTAIPDPYGLKGEYIGMPRPSLEAYESEFRCTNVTRKSCQ